MVREKRGLSTIIVQKMYNTHVLHVCNVCGPALYITLSHIIENSVDQVDHWTNAEFTGVFCGPPSSQKVDQRVDHGAALKALA